MNKRVYGVTLLLLFAASVATYFYRYDLHDWYVLRSYQASSKVQELSSSTGMSEYGERLFYVHDPQVQDAADFNSSCMDRGEASVVLGCFDGRTIFIFDVSDERVQGVQEITAAHEMLHAAFLRLGQSEKDELASWLEIAEQNVTNQRIKSVIASYNDLDEEGRINELHSIIGTEVRKLPSYLEDYYKKYFDDRSKLVDISEAYEKVFIDIREELKAYDSQLATLALDIKAKELGLETKSVELIESKQELEDLLASGQSQEYNQLVPGFNKSVSDYNKLVLDLKAQITEYNQIVIDRNVLGAEQNDLAKSIDSRFDELEEE